MHYMSDQPSFTISPAILDLVARISEMVGRLTFHVDQSTSLRLRRLNRIQTTHGLLAIKSNTLGEEHIPAILSGKRVLASPQEIQEALEETSICHVTRYHLTALGIRQRDQ